MKRTTITATIAKNDILIAARNNKSLIVIFSLFLVGVLCGAMFVKSGGEDSVSFISDILQNYISARSGRSFFSVFAASFVSALPYLLFLFIFGMSPAGPVLTPAAILIRGVGTGLLSGFLYSVHALKGIAFSAILVIPAHMISAFALILASREAFCFSCRIARAVSIKGEPINLSGDFRIYCFRFLFILLILLISAFLDSILSISFMGFFHFS